MLQGQNLNDESSKLNRAFFFFIAPELGTA